MWPGLRLFKRNDFKLLILMNYLLCFQGNEFPREVKVPARPEQERERWFSASPSVSLVCHSYSTSAALHTWNQNQKLHLQNKTQTRLYPYWLWCQVSKTFSVLFLLDVYIIQCSKSLMECKTYSADYNIVHCYSSYYFILFQYQLPFKIISGSSNHLTL